MKKIKVKDFNFEKLKEMWKDKKGRAKIELSLYLIFFIFVIIFARVSTHTVNNTLVNQVSESFINNIIDNYTCDINIYINEDIYEYHLKVLGNNSSIVRKNSDEEKFYYLMNNKYYELDSNGNYILTTTDEVYPYINYNYLNVTNIKNYINNSTLEDNMYKLKVSDIILNNSSDDFVIIKVDEENRSIEINYTNLLKIDNENINSALVNITFSNINNIMSLEE